MLGCSAHTRLGSIGGLETSAVTGESDEEFAARMLQIRGGKVRASEARKISNRTIKLTDSQIHDQLADAARKGCYSSTFDLRQITDTAKKGLSNNWDIDSSKTSIP